MEKYLKLALEKLGNFIPFNFDELRQYYSSGHHAEIEKSSDYVYFLFSWPELTKDGSSDKKSLMSGNILERVIILVFDQNDQIIADMAAMHCKADDYINNEKLLDYLCEDGDWSYLEHYTLTSYFKDEIQNINEHAEIIEYNNSYVTKLYRNKGIFKYMVEMMETFVLEEGTCYEVISLDPDVACYGPDSLGVPYYYSYEKDEPVRIINAGILQNMGFIPIKLEDDEPGENDDGTKLWFAVKKLQAYEISGI